MGGGGRGGGESFVEYDSQSSDRRLDIKTYGNKSGFTHEYFYSKE
jgi:hypothetical protein